MQAYRLLFENALDAILLIDAQNFQIIDANNAAAELYAYRVEQLKQMSVIELAASPEKMTTAIQLAAVKGYRSPKLWHIRNDSSQIAIEIAFSRFMLDKRLAIGASIREYQAPVNNQDHPAASTFASQKQSTQLFLPICAACKKIRESQVLWTPIENYMCRLFAVKFSHSICPVCMERLYPQLNSCGQTRKLSQKDLNDQIVKAE